VAIIIKIKIMQNKVTKIFSDMTDSELSQAIKQIKEDTPKGIIRENGIVREKCEQVDKIIGGIHLTMVQFSILQEAAYRFTPEH
jgi:predicted transcriptional regulator